MGLGCAGPAPSPAPDPGEPPLPTPDVADASEVAPGPDLPVPLDAADLPDTPDPPDVPDLLDVPDLPDTPDAPAPPDLPDVEDTPDPGEPDPGPPPPFESATDLTLRGWSPFVPVTVDESEPIDFLIDTGAPITILDLDVFGGDPGAAQADLSLFGLTFEAVPVVHMDLFGTPPPGAIQQIGGIVGDDFLAARALVVDYRDARGWLLDALIGDPWVDVEVLDPAVVPLDLLGDTRVVVQGTIEGSPVAMVLDTGASHTIVQAGLLADDPDRPTLGGVGVTLAGAKVEATIYRAASVAVGGAELAGPAVMVLPNDVFPGLEAETGQPIQALIGGTTLRHFLLTVNIPQAELRLARYPDDAHISPTEWVGPGFEVVDGPGGDFPISDVYEPSPAAEAGVAPGFLLASVDGELCADYDLDEIRALLESLPIGHILSAGFRAQDDSIIEKLIEIVDLLPAWP